MQFWQKKMHGVLSDNHTGLVYFTSKNECLYYYALYSLLRRPDFDRSPVHVEFMVNKVTMRQVCFPVSFPLSVVTPSVPHSYLYSSNFYGK